MKRYLKTPRSLFPWLGAGLTRAMAILAAALAVDLLLGPAALAAAQETPTPQPVSSATPTAQEVSRAFQRFELHQKVLKSFTGTFSVAGPGYSRSQPVAAKAGDSLGVFLMAPEQMGPYRLQLTADGAADPVLWLEGELERTGEGQYRHRYIASSADASVLALAPDEEGVVIAIGYVLGSIQLWADLRQPASTTLSVGVDIDGDGSIDPAKEVFTQASKASTAHVSITIPRAVIPLTSKYTTSLSVDGVVIAHNDGVYNFLDNKAGVNADKDSKAAVVREYGVRFSRTPVATRVQVLNATIYQRPVIVKVEPREEENTEDVLRQGNADATPTPGPTATPSPGPTTTSVQAGMVAQGNGGVQERIQVGGGPQKPGIGDWLVNHWVILTLAGAVAVGLVLLLRRQQSAPQAP